MSLCPRCKVNEKQIFKTGKVGAYCKACQKYYHDRYYYGEDGKPVKIPRPPKLPRIPKTICPRCKVNEKHKFPNCMGSYCLVCVREVDKETHKRRMLEDPVEIKRKHRLAVQKYLRKTDNERFRRYRKMGMKEIDTSLTLAFVMDWFNCECQECFNICEFGGEYKPTIDYIVPLKSGGQHVKENVRLLCRSCMQIKWRNSIS